MRQEQFNYEYNTSIAQTKNLIGAVSSVGSAVTTGNYGGLLQGGTDYAINKMMIDMQHQNHGEYINMMMAQKEKQSLLPNSATLGSSNSTLLGYEYFNKCNFVVYNIRKEFAEKIDKYFTCYGYATNKIKKPNLYTRSQWNYVKTVGANIVGNIPSLDLQRIKDMFDTGITLWHNPDTYLNYDNENY